MDIPIYQHVQSNMPQILYRGGGGGGYTKMYKAICPIFFKGGGHKNMVQNFNFEVGIWCK